MKPHIKRCRLSYTTYGWAVLAYRGQATRWGDFGIGKTIEEAWINWKLK